MNYPINKKCIVRCTNAGVFFGELKEFDAINKVAEINNVRRIWFWSGAATLSQLAAEGVKKPYECKFTMAIDRLIVTDVIEIIPCTDEAIQNIEDVPVWKM